MLGKTQQAELRQIPLEASSERSPSQLQKLDLEWSLALHKRFSPVISRQIFMMLEHSGNGILWLLLAPILWLWAPISSTDRQMVANFFFGLWVDLALVGSLKGIFKRPRPVYNISGDFVIVVAVDQYSFPSGHAARRAPHHLCIAFASKPCTRQAGEPCPQDIFQRFAAAQRGKPPYRKGSASVCRHGAGLAMWQPLPWSGWHRGA